MTNIGRPRSYDNDNESFNFLHTSNKYFLARKEDEEVISSDHFLIAVAISVCEMVLGRARKNTITCFRKNYVVTPNGLQQALRSPVLQATSNIN